MKKTVFSVLATVVLATSIASSNAEAANDEYIVKTGDTLWKIATLHKLTVDELKDLNGFTKDSITVSQKIYVKKKTDMEKNDKVSIKNSVTVTKQTSSTNEFKTPVAHMDKPIISSSPSLTAQAIQAATVDVAMPLIDTPYKWAGTTIEGFDCSGFIHFVFTTAGLDLQRLDTIGMYNNSSEVVTPVPGDLVFFENTYRKGISHAGIYLGDGQFIHAGTKKVEIAKIDSVYWKDKFVGFNRFNQLQTVQ
ncbi:C40 family peptidase [Sporosarcina sp. Sa2YVA2]|uniref:C40 family peptidase n=1 Tax=Sporosarcina quadrami TaxID=2762234 RepID=A0ABR8U9H6_9BACL|nr:C40 family peptidase [Sporosarcina quadrami]MBD7984697.1 C40 family peptidase [Sporosarcina quadrami]